MMKLLVTVLLISFSTTVLTIPLSLLAAPGSGVDSTMVLEQLETALNNYGAGVNTFKDTIQNFINGYKSLVTDYEDQIGILETQANIAEAANNKILEAELEEKGDALETLAEEYADTAEMLGKVVELINDQEQKMVETFGQVTSGLKRTAEIESQLLPSAPAPEPEPVLPTVGHPEPEPTPVADHNRELQALIESLLAHMSGNV